MRGGEEEGEIGSRGGMRERGGGSLQQKLCVNREDEKRARGGEKKVNRVCRKRRNKVRLSGRW